MNAGSYLATPAWRDLVADTVDGRPARLWRERPRHILDLLDLACRRDDLDYLVQAERRFSFADFHHAIEVGAHALRDAGVRPGDRVLIVLHNRCEVPLVQWAAWRLGAVPVFGNRWWSEAELAAIVAATGPAAIVTDMTVDNATRGRRTLLRPEEIERWWRAPPASTPIADPRARADESDVCLIVYTAGSTGGPKGVGLMHRNLIWTMQTLHVMQGGRPPEPADAAAQKVALITTPMFHNGAIVSGVLSLVDGNRMVALKGKFATQEVLDLIERERITSWLAVPTMFRRLMRDSGFGQRDLSSLIAPSTGGTMVEATLIDEISAALPHARDNLSVAYGMTEMSFVSMATAAQLRARPGTVGQAVLGVEVAIANPDADGNGEILARSGALMHGYLDAPVQPIDADGWYHTGDVGRLDADGFLFITGRAKDMVIRGGENISCPHVEAALQEHPDILEVAVTGVPDPDLGEALVAFIAPRPGVQLPEAALVAFAREKLAYFAVPSRWAVQTDPLPTLPTGKIDKQALLARFLAIPPSVA
ncbi:class I adenylate-forming enzyme family protein [Sphingomonas sp.]|uniref:class I adenylate-forming enzyme family protein n=1 Tax=Sphingomonas sp. TaxID=28214 RepID=UPI001ED4E216|nr:class I adenylate-forming enzyme family protein [Sphingomonas sp.]MBX3595031.1 acyl--CoA ligase [Sphingomonas sp.]